MGLVWGWAEEGLRESVSERKQLDLVLRNTNTRYESVLTHSAEMRLAHFLKTKFPFVGMNLRNINTEGCPTISRLHGTGRLASTGSPIALYQPHVQPYATSLQPYKGPHQNSVPRYKHSQSTFSLQNGYRKPFCNWPAATLPGRTLDINHLVTKRRARSGKASKHDFTCEHKLPKTLSLKKPFLGFRAANCSALTAWLQALCSLDAGVCLDSG